MSNKPDDPGLKCTYTKCTSVGVKLAGLVAVTVLTCSLAWACWFFSSSQLL